VKREPQTKVTDASVTKFLDGIKVEEQRRDCQAVIKMMKHATGAKPKMWGSSIVGFDSYHYVGKSCEGDWLLTGVSPRKETLALYIFGGWDKDPSMLQKLGKHSLGKGCLYIKRLSDVHIPSLTKLIEHSVKRAKKQIQAGAADMAKQSNKQKLR
jgi:hypothetical protein